MDFSLNKPPAGEERDLTIALLCPCAGVGDLVISLKALLGPTILTERVTLR